MESGTPPSECLQCCKVQAASLQQLQLSGGAASCDRVCVLDQSYEEWRIGVSNAKLVSTAVSMISAHSIASMLEVSTAEGNGDQMTGQCCALLRYAVITTSSHTNLSSDITMQDRVYNLYY